MSYRPVSHQNELITGWIKSSETDSGSAFLASRAALIYRKLSRRRSYYNNYF